MSTAATERRHSDDFSSILRDIEANTSAGTTAAKNAEAASKETQADLGKLHLKLFGAEDQDRETEHGRIPRIERKVENDNTRLKWLERIVYTCIGGGMVIYFILEKAIK